MFARLLPYVEFVASPITRNVFKKLYNVKPVPPALLSSYWMCTCEYGHPLVHEEYGAIVAHWHWHLAGVPNLEVVLEPMTAQSSPEPESERDVYAEHPPPVSSLVALLPFCFEACSTTFPSPLFLLKHYAFPLEPPSWIS